MSVFFRPTSIEDKPVSQTELDQAQYLFELDARLTQMELTGGK